MTMNVLSSWISRFRSGDPVVVVSGLPRSGTSLVMQMLGAGGVPLADDGHRREDEDNPRGYFELEPVKSLDRPGDRTWVKSCRGKAVKVVSPLLRNLPRNESYRVVFALRDLEETLLSQEKMLRRRGGRPDGVSDEKMLKNYELHLERIGRFLERAPNFRTLYVSYGDILERPAEQAGRIGSFLGRHLDEEAMAATVDRSLYRSRTAAAETGGAP